MSVVPYQDYSPVANLHVGKQNIDKNLATMIDPTVDGICPNGMTQPVMVKVFPINQNLVLNNGTDLVIVWSPESATQVQGELYAVNPQGRYTYVGDVRASVDLSTYSEAMTVSSVLVVFSDTISTTTVVLSGRLSSVGMFSVLNIRPTWDSMGKYVSDPKAALINVSLAEGCVCLQCPNPKKIMHQVNTQLGHSKDFYMAQAPIGSVQVPNGRTSWLPTWTETRMDLGLHALSGKYPVFISAVCAYRNSVPGQGNSVGWNPEQSNLAVRFYQSDETYVEVQLSVYYTEWAVIPPVNTVAVSLNGNLESLPAPDDTPATATGPMTISVFSGNPLTADSSSMKYIIYIQGNIGEKNINISGWTRYEMIPTPENMQLATYRRILAYNPMTFEAFQVLLDGVDFFRLCTNRSGYAKMLELIPYLTLGEVGELADHAASASLALAPLIRGVVSKLKQLGISPAGLMKKGTRALYSAADRGVDRLEQLGFAKTGHASSNISDGYTREIDDCFQTIMPDPPLKVLTTSQGRSAALPVGYKVSPYSTAAVDMSEVAYGSAGYAMEGIRGVKSQGSLGRSKMPEIPDGDITFGEAAPAQQPSANDLRFVREDKTFPADLLNKCVDCTFKSNKWKYFVNGAIEGDEDLIRVSFFYVVSEATVVRTGMKFNQTVPCALVLSLVPMASHDYVSYGKWEVDKIIDDKELLDDKYTSLDYCKMILSCTEVVGPLRVLTGGKNSRYTEDAPCVYISIHVGDSSVTEIKDTSYTGALFTAIHSENPLVVAEAACLPYSIEEAGGSKVLGTLANWATPSELQIKLTHALKPLSDGYFKNLKGFYKDYVPIILLSSANSFNNDILYEISKAGLSFINGVPTGQIGLVDLVSDMRYMIKPPFRHKVYTQSYMVEKKEYVLEREKWPEAVDGQLKRVLEAIEEDYGSMDTTMDKVVSLKETFGKLDPTQLKLVSDYFEANPTLAELKDREKLAKFDGIVKKALNKLIGLLDMSYDRATRKQANIDKKMQSVSTPDGINVGKRLTMASRGNLVAREFYKKGEPSQPHVPVKGRVDKIFTAKADDSELGN